MAHWSTDPTPSRSVVETLSQLDSSGYETVLVSAGEFAGPLGRVCSWAPGAPALPMGTTLLRRANVGYDFGTWASVLAALPGLRVASRTLLINDSVVGPLTPLAPALAAFDACPDPVWGLVASHQHRRHIQSFFMGFRDGELDRPVLRRFFSDVRVEASKAKIVRFYELGLAEALDEWGISWTALADELRPVNPTLALSEELLSAGVPFLKANAVPRSMVEYLHQWLTPGEDRVGPDLRWPARLRFAWDVEGVRRPRGRAWTMPRRTSG